MVLGVLFFGLLVWVGITRLDPDFGWHIKTGEYTAVSGVDRTDRFTYTLADFAWVDHEWALNIGMYKMWQKWGMPGEAVAFAVVGILALGVMVWAGGKKWMMMSAMLTMAIWLPRAGVRPQILDWLFLGLIIWGKKKWWWPILFLIWVNMHGGFAIGIGVGLVLVVFGRKVKDWLAWGLSVGTTFINPYGWRIWEEVWRQATDGNLRWSIAEWQPFYARVELGFLMMLVMVWVLVWRYKKVVVKWQMAVLAGLTVAGLTSMRHIALFAVMAGPMIGQGFLRLEKEVVKDKLSEGRMKIFGRIFAGLAILVLIMEVLIQILSGFSYPKEAVSWLRQEELQGQVFSKYDWGGYLIWQYPEKKVFVDGRTPSWRTKDKWIFKEYLKAVNDGKWQEVFEKYNVQTVLWSVEKDKDEAEKDFPKRLEKAGWRTVYKDNGAVVMVK